MRPPAKKGKKSTHEPSRETLRVQIDDLAPGGFGVAHAAIAGESRAIFVPGVALSDQVDVLVDLSARPARGRVVALVTAGPGRIAPPCTYVTSCGACDWMQLSRVAQRTARESHLRRALPRAFRDAPLVVHDDVPSLGYRTRTRLHVRASGGRAVVGPFGVGSHEVIDVAACVILHPTLDAALVPVAGLLEGAHGTGEVHLALGEGGRPVVELRWNARLPPACFGRVEQAVSAGTFRGVSLYEQDAARPAVVGDPTPEMIGADGAILRLARGGFAQASDVGNLELGERVLALARSSVRDPGEARAVELYAGAGNFTVLLARAFGRLVAVESSPAACDAARANLASRGLVAKVTCADADAFALPPKTDVVVLDPPRRGARTQCALLASSSVKAIVYVSCDTATLGRDLALLEARFAIATVETFAMFPGTSHSETVVLLRQRAHGPS